MIRAALALALALPSAHAALPVTQGDGWLHPGRAPYTGTPEAALASMRLPADVRARLLARIDRNEPDGIVYMTRGGIVADDGQVYAPRFDMTHRGGIALHQRIVYGPERTEVADRYTDGEYVVIRPSVCGNWSRLYPAGYPGATLPTTVLPDAGALDSHGWHGWHAPGTFGVPGAFYAVPHGSGPWQVPAVPPVHMGPGPHGPAPLNPAIPVSVPGTALLVAAGIAAAALRRQP